MPRATRNSSKAASLPGDVDDIIDPLSGSSWPAVTHELLVGAADEVIGALYSYLLKHAEVYAPGWKRRYEALPRGLQLVCQFNFFWGGVLGDGPAYYFVNKPWFFTAGPEAFREFGASRTANVIKKLTDEYWEGEKEWRWCEEYEETWPGLFKWNDYLFDSRSNRADFRKLTRWIRKHPDHCLHTPKKRRPPRKQSSRRKRGK